MKLFTTFENCDDGVLRVNIIAMSRGKRRTVGVLALVLGNPEALKALVQAAGVLGEGAAELATLPGGAS